MDTFNPPIDMSSKFLNIDELRFRLFIPNQSIQERIQVLSNQIKNDYTGKNPVVICVLKGAVMFATDLIQSAEIECEMDFVRLSSYNGITSTGKVIEMMSSAVDVADRHVLIVEDIVDSGRTLNYFMKKLREQNPKSIELAALLFKPKALKFPIDIKYLGFSIPDLFVVGYGLDYNESGREHQDIYQLDLPDPGM